MIGNLIDCSQTNRGVSFKTPQKYGQKDCMVGKTKQVKTHIDQCEKVYYTFCLNVCNSALTKYTFIK